MTAKGLMKAASTCKSVAGLPWGHTSASFVIGLPFRQVMAYLPKLKIYKPKKK
jgi:hypothetical protein